MAILCAPSGCFLHFLLALYEMKKHLLLIHVLKTELLNQLYFTHAAGNVR